MVKIKFKPNKRWLKEKVATFMTMITIVATSIPAFMYATATPVQAAGTVEGGNVIEKGKDANGNQVFAYGTSFSSAAELRSYLVSGATDTEDGNIDIAAINVDNLKAGSDVENVVFSTMNQAWNKVLSAGTYTASFSVTDKGGKTAKADISFSIVSPDPVPAPIPYIQPTTTHKYYLQGTPITNELLSRGAKFLDTVAYKYLEFTEGTVTQGKYAVVDWGGLDSNKIMNNGNGYDYEYYMTHKAECDAKNTYTITYAYKGNGDTEVSYATSKVTIVPVFPTFSYNENDYQIFEGFEATYDGNGKITGFTNRIGIDYLKRTDTLNLHAWSVLNGDVDACTENVEDCSDSIYLHSTTYANGVTETGKDFITTSTGVYGDDLKGTKNDDGTFTLEDGSIYPYRGNIDFVVGAVNSYKNSRLSAYDTEFDHTLAVHNPNPEFDEYKKDQLDDLDDLDDEDMLVFFCILIFKHFFEF